MRRAGRRDRTRTGAIIASVTVSLAALAFIIMPLFGIHAYVITGASMTGSISQGAVILTRTVPVETLQVGDVITFCPPGDTANVTHRIISIEQQSDGSPAFRTKGDFNESADPWLFTLERPVQARFWAQIPYVGYALALLNLPIVRALLFAVPALIVVVALFVLLWRNAGSTRWFGGTTRPLPDDGAIPDPAKFRRVDRRRR